jgi:hippurate hydrolase
MTNQIETESSDGAGGALTVLEAPPAIAISPSVRAQMADDYRHLHAHPELSLQEHATAQFIERRLEELGVDHQRCGGTGVVATLRNGAGPIVAFRADTDGLPIKESTGLDYASKDVGIIDGKQVPVMHGCGHDTHIACGLAVARLFAENPEAWSGTIVFIFQPAEELGAGAAAMVADGLWEKAPKPVAVYGQHVGSGLAGTVSYTPGAAMSMSDSFKITLSGVGAHGSRPQESIDPIVLGASIISRLQTVVAREISPQDAAVLTVGLFQGGFKANIIPDSAEFTINTRAFSPEVRQQIHSAFERIISHEAQASRAGEPVIEHLSQLPLTFNDIDETASVAAALAAELGADNVIEAEPRMGSEDFGNLAQAIGVPSVFWGFGSASAELIAQCKDAGKPVPSNHTPNFAPVIGPTLETGTRAAIAVLLDRLRRG